jgi:hypothetical protein
VERHQARRKHDVYVIAALAVVLAIVSTLDIVPESWIAEVTLGVLALLAFAGLVSRHKLDEIRSTLPKGV